MTSIRVRLLKWLIGPILLVNLAGASLTYLLAWTPAEQAFDQAIADSAAALAARLQPGPHGAVLDLPKQAEQLLRTDQLDALYFVVRGADGALMAGDADFPPLAAGAALADASMRGQAVRVAQRSVRVGQASVRVAVAKTLRKRAQMRAAIIGAMVPLEALFTFALAGLIWFSVTNGLAPLARMRSDLNGRDGADLTPIDTDVPYELAPVVGAFNGLLGKVEAGARAQHDFLADVAHQLRTPLAGVKLQLEWLDARHGSEPDTARSIRLMLLSNARMIRQTNQLLALARAEPSRFEKKRLGTLDLAQLVQDSIQYFVEEAAKKGIDLGFELAPAPIAGDRFLLRDLLDNLVDNALRYTPAGGSVTVSCRRDGTAGVLLVEDSGPGIAPASRERVFERFVRLDDTTSGSGLGLAIVRDIALAHGARVSIDAGKQGQGALVQVRFPA
ncbi:MAG: sensor histidine kinase [Pseudomonadota bacterium]|nr:sensor histidine kinase [Pseudomonadota bacterium]